MNNVIDRNVIQLQIGNFQRNIKGCILVGQKISTIGNQCMVTNSGFTIEKIRSRLTYYSEDKVARMTRGDVPITFVVK